MAINERKVEKVVSFKGQRSGLPVEAYGFDSAQTSKNFILKEGALERTRGGVTYADILELEPGGVKSIHAFKNLWAAQRGFSFVLETAEASASFNTVLSDLEFANRFFSAQWRDRLFLANGKEAKFVLNRTSTTIDPNVHIGSIGMDPPDAEEFGGVVTTETNLGTGNIVNGSYHYVVTVFDGETNSESPGCGSTMSVDGLFELSLNTQEPNGTNFGVKPKSITVLGGPCSVAFEYASLATFLQSTQADNPRATDFSIYRCTRDSTTGLFNTLFAVPNTQAAGETITNIEEFLLIGDDFVDDTATADLPAISPPENNSPPPTIARLRLARIEMSKFLGVVVDPFVEAQNSGIKTLRFFRDQLFGFGAFSTGWNRSSETQPVYNEVGRNAFSDILFGSEVFQPDYFPYIWEVGRGDGQRGTALGVLGDTALLVFKERSTYYLSGSSPADFVMRILDTNKGCLAAGSVQETPFGVVTLDASGFALFSKIGQGEKISTQIQDVIDSILFEFSDTFYSWYDNYTHRYYCAVVIAGSQTPNITLCLDLDSMEWTYTQGQEGLSRATTSSSLGEFVDMMGSATNGRLTDSSNPDIPTFQGAVIESIWTSGTLSFGDDQHKKRMRWLYLKVRAVGDWTVTLEVIPDFNESRKFTIGVNYSSDQQTWFSSSGSTDGTLYWDEGVWAFDGPERSQVKIPIVSKGRLFQVRVINVDTAANRNNFAMEGISAEAVMLDK